MMSVLKVYLGFVLIRYKTCWHRNDCHEGRSPYSQILKNSRHCTPHRAMWGKTRAGQEVRGESMAQILIALLLKRNGNGMVGTLSKLRIG